MGTSRRVDLTGLRCPMPIVKLTQIVKELDSGEEVVAVATDPAFCLDVEAWCRLTGHELLDLRKTGEGPTATIRVCRKDQERS